MRPVPDNAVVVTALQAGYRYLEKGTRGKARIDLSVSCARSCTTRRSLGIFVQWSPSAPALLHCLRAVYIYFIRAIMLTEAN